MTNKRYACSCNFWYFSRKEHLSVMELNLILHFSLDFKLNEVIQQEGTFYLVCFILYILTDIIT